MFRLSAVSVLLGAARLAARVFAEVGTVASSADYLGQVGRVLLPVSRESLGTIRLELKGTTVDVLATTEEKELLVASDHVVVIEMRDAVAVVTRTFSTPGQEY